MKKMVPLFLLVSFSLGYYFYFQAKKHYAPKCSQENRVSNYEEFLIMNDSRIKNLIHQSLDTSYALLIYNKLWAFNETGELLTTDIPNEDEFSKEMSHLKVEMLIYNDDQKECFLVGRNGALNSFHFRNRVDTILTLLNNQKIEDGLQCVDGLLIYKADI